MLRMDFVDRISGWFYYVFIRGRDKRSEGDLSRLSIINDFENENLSTWFLRGSKSS